MKFKSWCKEHKYTAKKIEEITGISRATIFSYWQDVRTPSRAREAILKELLGIPDGLFDK